jgi:hypothetical protein
VRPAAARIATVVAGFAQERHDRDVAPAEVGDLHGPERTIIVSGLYGQEGEAQVTAPDLRRERLHIGTQTIEVGSYVEAHLGRR